MSAWTDRHRRVTQFALRFFLHTAMQRSAELLQYRRDSGQEKTTEVAHRYLDDAKSAEEALSLLDSVLPQTAFENVQGDGI